MPEFVSGFSGCSCCVLLRFMAELGHVTAWIERTIGHAPKGLAGVRAMTDALACARVRYQLKIACTCACARDQMRRIRRMRLMMKRISRCHHGRGTGDGVGGTYFSISP